MSTTAGDSTAADSPRRAWPVFSVVICTRDRPAALLACVRSVVRQDLRPLELIVVDDGRLDQAERPAVEDLCAAAGIAFIYLPKDRPGLPRSRNLAVRRARGTIVQFLDDDVTLEDGFFREVMRLYAEDDAGALLGTEGTLLEPAPRSRNARIFDWMYRLAGWWALRPRRQGKPPRPACLRNPRRAELTWNIVGATMAFRRAVLTEQLFDEGLTGYALGEDRDMAYRLSAHGWLARCRAARAVHHHEYAGRPEPYAFGRMIVQNYTRIMARNGFTRIGDRLVIVYGLSVVALSLLGFSISRPRSYFPQFLGMLVGGIQVIAGFIGQAAANRTMEGALK